jgi:hypothetical protein
VASGGWHKWASGQVGKWASGQKKFSDLVIEKSKKQINKSTNQQIGHGRKK